MDEEGIESPAGGGGGHRPDQDLDGEGHELGDFIAEHDGEERRERPDGGLDRVPARGVAVQALVEAQAGEEGDEVEVGDGDEDDGARVAVGAVDGHAGVEGQEGESQTREPRELGHSCGRRRLCTTSVIFLGVP